MKQVGETLSEMMMKMWERSKKAYSFEDLEDMAENLEEPYCFWAQKEINDRFHNWNLVKHTFLNKDLWMLAERAKYPYCDWAMAEIIRRQKNKQND